MVERSDGDRLRVHVYAQCWNDEFMLPFFFRHFDRFADRYVFYDDGSSDNTCSILAQHPKTELRRFPRSDANSFVRSEQALSNDCWKECRGEADWVIVTDVDEHLFHSAMRQYLQTLAIAGVTVIPALGFQMITADVPRNGELLCEKYLFGTPWEPMMKVSIFKPTEIDEINFHPGRHRADPIGNVRLPNKDELVLLHYKYLNFLRTFHRHKQLRSGLRPGDHVNGWGHKYAWSMNEFEEDWNKVSANARDVRRFTEGSIEYPLPKWWDKFRDAPI